MLYIHNIMIPRFGIVGSGLQYEANFHWKNWTRPVANWVSLPIFIKNTECSWKNQNEKRLKIKDCGFARFAGTARFLACSSLTAFQTTRWAFLMEILHHLSQFRCLSSGAHPFLVQAFHQVNHPCPFSSSSFFINLPLFCINTHPCLHRHWYEGHETTGL